MILIIVEGLIRELQVFKTLEHLYFNESSPIICSYCNNIYSLYNEMTETGFVESAFSIIRKAYQKRGDHLLDNIKEVDISETFLFFDYDCHNQNKENNLTLKELNDRIKILLDFFDEETDNGKLYISYPMAEAVRYTKKLPDGKFIDYTLKISESGHFKELMQNFSDYGNYDFLCFRLNSNNDVILPENSKQETIKANWELLKEQNVLKANIICGNNITNCADAKKIAQKYIFDSQLSQFETQDLISILSAFPIFIFDYFIVKK